VDTDHEFVHRLRSMWSRARLDLDWGDLIAATVASFAPDTTPPERLAALIVEWA
jgi:hypothetical protein